MNELPTRYSPQETEEKWYTEWEKKGYFHAGCNPDKTPFTIVIPPPNVTGILHMGHALNDTFQDVLIRMHRMKGEEALWMPGTDHAGIATQNVVEKSLAKEGLKRQDLGREKFIERVWQWKEQYGSTIIRQLKKLGASCDWQRTRFTMDQEYSKAVTDVFIHLYEKDLIYQGSYIINWCPRCQTALSDEEAPHQELQGNLYYLRYPLKDAPGTHIVVATTRPETMLGDTAVAVNPKDRRYKKLIGKSLILPLVDRVIPVIADPMVDMKFGTGAVKVTPAHDPNDYTMGKKHSLEFINVFHPDARINENGGTYAGMDRFQARKKIIEDLTEKGLLEKITPHALSAGHCYRCATIIEPYLSKQWFVRMKPLAEPAIAAVKQGKITFYPKRWTKVYLNWMEQIQDWCISRQIWWGHRIPVYYCTGCGKIEVARSMPQKCSGCGGHAFRQDEDVLDTWFSSWLWPFATFHWPFTDTADAEKQREELAYFYPTAVLVTAPEIIFFWVARMIMAGIEFMHEIPFKDVYIHGTVRDIDGKKMSKSLGNVIDPLDIIKEYGTDALRFSLIAITAQGQDVFLAKERFEQGRNFANKIWNAARFVLMNLDSATVAGGLTVDKKSLDPINAWILSRLHSTIDAVNKNLNDYKFNEAANRLYSFFWHEFCDWYLELIKTDIKKEVTQRTMCTVLEQFLRTLHPFMPFITEEIWQKLPHSADSIMRAAWPPVQRSSIDRKVEQRMEVLASVVTTIRNARADLEVGLTQQIEVELVVPSKAHRLFLESVTAAVQNLCKAQSVTFLQGYTAKTGCFATVVGDMHISIPLSGVIDLPKQVEKLDQKIAKITSDIKAKQTILANSDFVRRAPKEIVEKERARLDELTGSLTKIKAVKDGLQ